MVAFKFIISYAMFFATVFGANDRIRYVITEHPEITWFNKKYARSANLTSHRMSREDPLYYVGLRVDTIWPVNYNVNVDFYFYELLSNRYKPSFIELHFEVCDLIKKDLLFGISFAKYFAHPCPLEPGIYHVDNITVPFKNIPENAPFTKGRISANFTSRDTHELLGYGHLDMEIKEISVRRMKNRNKGSFEPRL